MIDLGKEVLEDRISTDYKKILNLLKNQLWPILWEEK
jgi:hypothetical protein